MDNHRTCVLVWIGLDKFTHGLDTHVEGYIQGLYDMNES